MFDAKFFEQFVPACIEIMRDNFEVTGEVGVVVQLADGGSVIVNSVLPLKDPEIVALGCVFPGKKGDLATRMTTVCVPVKSITRVDLVTHTNNPAVTGKQRKFAGYISRRAVEPPSSRRGKSAKPPAV